ncbi:ATP-binding protein [Brevibacillus agri]|uniref:ATP-binding protein n=1 Tax=Brevibacillus agri TaxID=51101 RepID=UPI002E1BDE1B|nr:ATP-binding protein [Brevibacillus agri]MED1646117.1 ATP-binding protein [Brevibacillus agri]MED1657484.1 ATP-binding protein [Brevibacillus agri]MED1690129.1 ATP-binding protein [Brevibacillus agri]MED1694445.1 ATP-binding protein [Brevibacillus agri]MED1700307.1 ATP-binding protein [Brevibacillus agri]
MGNLSVNRLAANLLIQVVSARYERVDILLTSNKSFGNGWYRWTTGFFLNRR